MRGKGQGGKHLIAAATPSGITLDPPAPLYCREFPRAGASPGATADPQHPCDFSRNGIYHQRLKSQVFRLQTKTVFIHSEENCLHRSYCFWLSADLGFTSGLYYLSATTGNFLFFFFNNEFLDDAVEETAIRKTCWFAKPPRYTPAWLCREWGFSSPWALDTAQGSFGKQITQYNLEQPLVFLLTGTHKSNISILLASELFTNKSSRISINYQL